MRSFWSVFIITLLWLAEAAAGPRLYDGTLIIHTGGNDTITGTSTPFTTNRFIPIPLGQECLSGQAKNKETRDFVTYYGAPTTFTKPTRGGNHCPEGINQFGHPLTGFGTIHTTGAASTTRPTESPRGFTIIRGDISAVTSGASLPYAFPWLFSVHYLDLRNQRGEFCQGCGPGRYGGFHMDLGARDDDRASISVRAGANKFGGTLQLLGTHYSSAGDHSGYDTYVAKYTWLFNYVGAAARMSEGAITGPALGSANNTYACWNFGCVVQTTVRAKAMSWTTGTVSVAGLDGSFTTRMARAGFDNRDANGYGEIQMVSPHLTRWIFGPNSYHSASIGILRINFAPEPHEMLLLGAGLSLLLLLYRAVR